MKTVKKDSGIYLYGAASIGIIVYNNLIKNEIKINGFIDKRAKEIKSFCGLPVYELTDPKISRTDIVYLSVKNVFEHEEIKNLLAKEGYQYIIYKPYNSLLGTGTKEENELAILYDELFQGSLSNQNQLVCINELQDGGTHDYAIVKEAENSVVVNIPVEFIYTNDYPKASSMEKWGNIPIQSLFTHINFFRYLNGDNTCTPEMYLKEYCEYTAKIQNSIQITTAWKNNVLRNRTQIFEQMKESLELDPEFFYRNAASAEWNSRGYFNLTSGKHRTTFLAALGRRYVPVNISKKDYELFRNDIAVDSVKVCLKSRKNKYVYIPHPYFYRGDHNRDDGTSLFVQWFMRSIGEKLYNKYGKVNFSELKVLDMTNDAGYTARYLIRCGCDVYRDIVPDELECSLNSLFQCEIKYKNCEEPMIVIAEGNHCDIEMLLTDKLNQDTVILLRNVSKRNQEYLSSNRIKRFVGTKVINQVQHSAEISCANLLLTMLRG